MYSTLLCFCTPWLEANRVTMPGIKSDPGQPRHQSPLSAHQVLYLVGRKHAMLGNTFSRLEKIRIPLLYFNQFMLKKALVLETPFDVPWPKP